MSKSINFGLIFTIMFVSYVSYTEIEGVETEGLNEELIDCIRNKILNRTNIYRNKHGFGSLKLKNEMNAEAQSWANVLASSTTVTIDHRPDNMYGETIIKTLLLPNIGETLVDFCYNLIAFVNGGESELRDNEIIGPMTQLLWKASTGMGVGVSERDDGYIFLVIHYYPKGNYENLYLDNLPEFNQEHVDEGKFALKSYLYFTFYNRLHIMLYQIFISNSKTGPVSIPKEIIYFENTEVLGSSKLPQQFNSILEPEGICDAEASIIRKQVFEKSNYYRKKHDIPSFKISKELNNYAQEWANHVAKKGKMEYRIEDQEKYGTNKFVSYPVIFADISEIAIDVWYNQISHVRENMNESEFYGNVDTGSLTQLLWKSSTHIGVGVGIDIIGRYFLVVSYTPGGNWPNRFIENLPKFEQKDIDAGIEAQKNFIKMSPAVPNGFFGPPWLQMSRND